MKPILVTPTGEKVYKIPADKLHYLKILDTIAFVVGSLGSWSNSAVRLFIAMEVLPALGIKPDPEKEGIDFKLDDGTLRIRPLDKEEREERKPPPKIHKA